MVNVVRTRKERARNVRDQSSGHSQTDFLKFFNFYSYIVDILFQFQWFCQIKLITPYAY